MGRGIEPLQVLLGSTRHRAKSSTAECKLTAACQEREPNSHQLGIQPCMAFRSLPISAEVIINEDFDPRSTPGLCWRARHRGRSRAGLPKELYLWPVYCVRNATAELWRWSLCIRLLAQVSDSAIGLGTVHSLFWLRLSFPAYPSRSTSSSNPADRHVSPVRLCAVFCNTVDAVLSVDDVSQRARVCTRRFGCGPCILQAHLNLPLSYAGFLRDAAQQEAQ